MNITESTTVLGVWAHPDDEAYLSTGLALRTIAAGGRVVHRHLTYGEHGTDDPVAWPPNRLASQRRQELTDSLSVVGVSDHEILGLGDGSCASTDPAHPVAWISAAICRLAPDLVVTFGPDGVTGHPDHIAVSRWTTRAWLECGIGTLVYAAIPVSLSRSFEPMYREIGMDLDPALAVPDDEIAARLDLDDDELDTKRRCLAAHASQTEPLVELMGEDRYRAWTRVEAFRLPGVDDIRAARPPQEVLA